MKPIASFEWILPSHATGWAQAWDRKKSLYAAAYVTPKISVLLDAGKSDGRGDPLVIYHWEIRGLDDSNFSLVVDDRPGKVIDHTSSGASQPSAAGASKPPAGVFQVTIAPGLQSAATAPVQGSARFTKILPAYGRYRATLTVVNSRGERSDPVSEVLAVQDLLVASIGDSMASGEGNPDQDIAGKDAPLWTDTRTHRSLHSGHAQVAVALENPHHSVTFLSFAASGAKIGEGLLGEYDGIEDTTGGKNPLPGQVKALADAIASRRIDHLLITAGLNNLGIGDDGFSSVITAFILPLVPLPSLVNEFADTAKDAVIEKLSDLGSLYDQLAWGLSRALHGRVRQALITEYPADIFQPRPDLGGLRQGCDALVAITDSEGDFLFEKGKELNAIIQGAAQRHGWVFVAGIMKAFQDKSESDFGHGYCSPASWYVGVEESKSRQGNEDGTIHPNQHGQKAIRDRILATMRANPPSGHRSKRVTVVFERIKITGIVDGPPMTSTPVTLGANGQQNEIGPVRLNQFINLPPKDFTFTFFVDDGLAGPFVQVFGRTVEPRQGPKDQQIDTPTGIDKNAAIKPVKLSFLHTFPAERGFGEGSHSQIAADNTKPGFEVHYHIDVIDEIALKSGVSKAGASSSGNIAP